MPRSRPRRRAAERGALAVEWVLTFTFTLTLVFAGVQLAMVFLADRVAAAAATEGARAARAHDGSAADGRRVARRYVAQQGSRLLLNPQVRATRGVAVARVEVRGQAPRVLPLPWFTPTISHASEGPVERFIGGSP